MKLNPRPLLLIATAHAVLALAACGSIGGSKPAESTTSSPAASNAGPKIGPGMNANGEVVNSKLVESGFGQKVKGLNDWEGEVTGKPAAGSKFSQLKVGMTSAQVLSMLGQPNDQGAHPTGKAFIPFYFGSDRFRYEVVYKGQGRLLFAGGAGFGWDGSTHLIWIIHSASEAGTR
jgi:hypothetical protein